ncbi:hypothetical protein [Bacillus sp. E(2018)]|uniref:hypothetical protein n=1 Tax=Bacillus sp. E(2018) TaxID=2502239 RepID=UPI0010F82D84|nr:hypothetical protein [Bacillus sp. E(2018)]
MKKKFENLFLNCINVIEWLESPGFLDMKKAGNILYGMFILVGGTLYFLEGNSRILDNILIGLMMVTVFTLFLILSIKFYWVKPPKFISKESTNPAQLFNKFSHGAFLYGIIIYSFFSSFFVIGIVLAIMQFILDININGSKMFYNVFFITSSLFTIFYFMYHISIKGISTKIIKARIRLYLAIITTIAAGLFGLSLKEILLPLITYLGIGLAWLSYFVEKIESEVEIQALNKNVKM